MVPVSRCFGRERGAVLHVPTSRGFRRLCFMVQMSRRFRGWGWGGGYFIVPMSEYFRALRVIVPIVHASMSPRGVFHSSNA